MAEIKQRAKMMGEEKISKILIKLAIPGIIAMLVNAVYNVVDTMFVGMLGNTSAIGAVAVAFPLFMIIAALGQMFGVGVGSYISRLLGEKNKELADRAASTTFFTSLVCGMVFVAFGTIFLVPLLKMFGATETIMPFAKDYSRILVIGAVFTVTNMTLNNMIRAEGNAKYSMFAISLGAGLNIILDPVFMFVLDMGVKGAAFATVLAQMISFIFLIRYYISGKSYIKISIKNFTFSQKIYTEVMKIGIATFTRQGLSSLSLALINVAAKPYGDAAVAAMGVTLRVISIGVFVVLGYNQGFQPVAGYNYGAKKYNRLRQAIKVSLKWTTAFATIITVIFMFFAEGILAIFSKDLEVVIIGARTIRAVSLLFPLFGFQQVYAALFQALGKGREALVLSLSRQGIFLIPSVIVLPKLFELNGVIFSQTVADFFTIIVTGILALKLNKKIREEENRYKANENAEYNNKLA
ncbi:MATE family efflux transporter [Paramaledivibacter caminithermalis]|jgi:putative MATE family efflux protein|uniref:Multidrug export protein MepA n=1 Tax=Paramaledivibacter caminithermalis (strain DSM 15212 / CIP 107654 / DViRD3) TaxID=1121301 RepID=A0A1M6P7S0_PARC5|nr:MATE family efflux transporter [Paramaledivibacter caminithermalis]SHK03962.1 putative efflux protein, MATE family [Paramaledivibacter caminithermalis DSM 15212]